MNDNIKVYTPEEVAGLLKLSKNTIYDLISRGEIIAKRIGKVYRIPASSLSFVFTGLDSDEEALKFSQSKRYKKFLLDSKGDC